jgi:hypothetical protein
MVRISITVLLALSAPSGVVFAQNPMGSLRGTVADSSGGRIAGARVTVADAARSLAREIQADGSGEFRLEDLAPGTYEIAANANGFAEARSEVIVAVSSVRTLSVVLHPESASEKV